MTRYLECSKCRKQIKSLYELVRGEYPAEGGPILLECPECKSGSSAFVAYESPGGYN